MSKFIDEARQLAAQCWCHETTSGREMDSTLAEVVAWKIAAWMDTAASMQAKLDEANEKILELKAQVNMLREALRIEICSDEDEYTAEMRDNAFKLLDDTPEQSLAEYRKKVLLELSEHPMFRSTIRMGNVAVSIRAMATKEE